MTPRREITLQDLLGVDAPATVTVKQTAELLGVSSDCVYEAAARGTLPFPILRLGRTLRVPVAPLLAALGHEMD